jgi:hypothetical protein
MLNFRVTARFKYTDGRSDAEWQFQQPHSIEEIKSLIQHVLTSEPVPSSFVVGVVPYQLNPCDEQLWVAAMRAHAQYKEVEPGYFEWTGEGKAPASDAMIRWFQMTHPYEAQQIEMWRQREPVS